MRVTPKNSIVDQLIAPPPLRPVSKRAEPIR